MHYRLPMLAATPKPSRGGAGTLSRIFGWRRLRFALLAALPFGVLLSLGSVSSAGTWTVRTMTVGMVLMLAFGVFEQWPSRLPPWLARWVLQLLGVVVAVPMGALLAYWMTTGGEPVLSRAQLRTGYFSLCVTGILFGPWIALGAMVRQRDALARDQALQFQLERSELERQALDARLRLLQTQVQPHFLFNTLANVRALVRAGSPQAPAVLDSLIAYLRAAVPRLDGPAPELGHELQLVRAYLELMHMRMPDRLHFSVHCDAAAEGVRCPPMALLTLVENAVRHGIDPSEEGGRIEVNISVRGGRCIARVIDTGVGFQDAPGTPGVGLSNLRERLQLAFRGDAQLRLSSQTPRGVCAELEFPAQPAAEGDTEATR